MADAMTGYEDLKPPAVWEIFREISQVPRDSGKETAAMEMLGRWAGARGLRARRDRVGNMLVTIPPSKGHEGSAPVVVQGHVDMVCEKDASSNHDFGRDPIRLRIDGDWVTAAGTTIGADNGIGVAMGLAVAADETLIHGPVEVLLTVDEERGLTGAAGIRKGFFTARRMINLDSEEDDGIFIGCAGGRDTILTLRIRFARPPRDSVARKVTVDGLVGGHSGLDIHRNRGNAIKILTRALLAAAREIDMRISTIEGGSKRNAIPRAATAIVLVPREKAGLFKKLVEGEAARIESEELRGIDDGLEVQVRAARSPQCFSLENSQRILRLLASIPNGVTAMSRAIEGLVESSSNLGVVRAEGAKVEIVSCSRSSVMSALESMAVQHRCLGELAGAEVFQPDGYPGWQPNIESKMLAVAREQYLSLFGREPMLKAVHAGLECGLLTEKYPDLDIISIGPTIVGAHSPTERVSIQSVQRTWTFFTAILAAIA